MKRWRIPAAAATAALAVLLAVPSASADETLASGFQSFSLTAVSGGQRIIADTIAGQPAGTVQSGVPEAEATMTSSTGHGLASVAWPSALAGNAGTLLLLLGPFPCTPSTLFDLLGLPVAPTCSPKGVPQPVMDQYHYLNSPVRAEALSPGKPSDDNSVPGAVMAARAGANEVSADAVLGSVLVSDFEQAGTARATSIVKPTGETSAVADARSAIDNIAFVGGEVTIGSVTSSAHGETNGKVAKSSGTTVVQDAKVHGIPVTIDAAGVHANGQTADAVGPATAAANQALAGFGMKMFVTRPTQTVKDAMTTYDAGSLIIEWLPPGAPGGVVFEFGAAHITAAATLPFDDSSLDVLNETLSAAPGGDISGGGLLGDTGGGGTGAIGPSQLGAPSLAAVPASENAPLPGGLDPWLVLLGLATVVAIGVGLSRLAGALLDGAATNCESGET